ncbi:DUF3857 and transglutaminase domain-containing protein [candidate division WOR-3 bacterium]|nr:DUF3857 and transglutaminase domain-containing protein [candidate division WOR-3 bacterium]
MPFPKGIRCITLLSVILSSASGAMIELHDTTSIETDVLLFERATVFSEGDTIDRSDVRVLTLSTRASKLDMDIDADQDIRELLDKAAQAQERFPDAKGVLLIDDGLNTLNEDGTRSYAYHFAYLVLSESRRSQGTYSGYFKEGENEIKILFARLIKPDGRSIELGPDDIIIQTSPTKGSLFFGRGKIVTFSMPEVEIGDIVEYSYENVRFNPWDKGVFEISYFFQGCDPFIYSRLVVDVPEAESLLWKAYRMPVGTEEPEITHRNGRKVYTWVAENVAPYVPEPYSPPSGDFTVKVQVSNQLNWDRIFDWYAGFQKERMKITPRIQELTDSLTYGAETYDEKISKIYHWIQKNVRYISVKGASSSGVSGHPAEFTLNRGFGDCTDKSILFSTMLEASGIEAYPVYVGTNQSVSLLDPQIPQYYGNHCITEVFLQDTSFYLDATGSADGGYSRYPSFSSADHGVYALNAQKRKIEIIGVPDADQHLRKYDIEIEVDKEGNLVVDSELQPRGPYEASWRASLSRLTLKEDQTTRFERMVNSIAPQAELLSFAFGNPDDFTTPFRFRLSYKLNDYVKFAGPVAIFKLPEVAGHLDFKEVSLRERKLPLIYSTSAAVSHNVTVTFPEEWRIAYLPEGLSLETEQFSYRAKYENQGNVISFSDSFERQKREIKPGDYPEYKSSLTRVSSYHTKPILFIIDGGSK